MRSLCVDKHTTPKAQSEYPVRLITTTPTSTTPQVEPRTAASAFTQQVQTSYNAVAAPPLPPAPQYSIPQVATNTIGVQAGAPGYQQQQFVASQPMSMSQSSQPHNTLMQVPNMIQTPNVQTVVPGQQYGPYYQMPMQQVPQPLGGVYAQQPTQFTSLQQFPAATLQQPQLQVQPQLQLPGAQPISSTPLPTLPPLTFPTLDQIPKIDIPSVEDVENVIPPVQRAILTTVARFFGVL
ncbi:hypothetical protein COOONC_01631 [Cooperia oncophora]